MSRRNTVTRTAFFLRLSVSLLLLQDPQLAEAQWSSSGGNTTTSDKVGIGTSSPGVLLHLVKAGDINNTEFAYFLNPDLSTDARQSYILVGKGLGNGLSTILGHLSKTTISLSGAFLGNYGDQFNEGLFVQKGGNVGVGNTAPGAKLDVTGDIRLSIADAEIEFAEGGPRLRSPAGNTLVFHTGGGFGSSTNEQMRITSAGNVGIGNTAPDGKLSVGDDPVGGSGNFTSTVAAGGTSAVFSDNTNSELYIRHLSSNIANFDVDSGNKLTFSDGGVENLRIDGAGNVGIGTANPTSRLHVGGDIAATGTVTGANIVAKYQDIAEWVKTVRPIAVGTVVILDPDRAEFVTESSLPYDTRVAGVISPRPGIILGEEGPDKVRVATTGRVRVRSDATGAPIRRGDLLVTSDKTGLAMRSEPLSLGGVPIHRPGTVIGKAIEALEQGQGEILVLLSLQ